MKLILNSEMSFILGIDQGTTGTTAIILNQSAKVVASCNIPFEQHFPKAGWVEHHPNQIWESIERSVRAVIKKAKIKSTQIECIGITNQRETVSLFKGSKALHPFIVWQDRRTTEDCKKLSKFSKKIIAKTGTPIDPYFSSTKIAYLYKKLGLSKKDPNIRFRTIDSFLINKMTGEDVIEATNAHRTQLMNLKSGKWDPELFKIFGIPLSAHPELIPSQGMNLKTKRLSFLPDGIPIQACLGDQQAALFGQAAWRKGEGKITYGTGAFILVNTGENPIWSKNKMVSTLAIQWKNGKRQFAVEGSVFICGAWVQWLRDQLQIISQSGDIEGLAKRVENSNEVLVIPALAGMGAPFWKANLRGAILGLSRGSNRMHLARASLEALAFQNKALIDAIKKDAPRLKTKWKVDGGAVKNDLLMQIQSDALGLPIYRPKNLEATSTGVALLAGYSQGIFSMAQIKKSIQIERAFRPQLKKGVEMRKLYQIWYASVQNLSPRITQ